MAKRSSSSSDDAHVVNPFALAFSLVVYAHSLYVTTQFLLFVYDAPTGVPFVDEHFPAKVGAGSLGKHSAETAKDAELVAHATVYNGLVFLPFVLQHSIMARQKFKRFVATFAPSYVERSLYVLASGLSLQFLMSQWRPLVSPDIWWLVPRASPLGYGLDFVYFGFFAALVAVMCELDYFDMYGVRQGYLADRYTPVPLVVRGSYRFVRHPMSLCIMLIMVATPILSRGRALLALYVTLYIVFVGTPLEEKSLVHKFGDRYTRYQQRVPALCPMLTPANIDDLTAASTDDKLHDE